MMYRNELKYMINKGTALVLSNKIRQICEFDKNADENGFYRVSSLYFDDFANSALNDNIIGQIERKKYRIRIYNGSDKFIRLEKKVKHNKGGMKISAPLTREEYDLILQGDYESLKQSDSALLRAFATEATFRHLKPKVIVDYHRQTFVCDEGTVRVTLDHQVQHSLGNVDLFAKNQIYVPATQDGQVVLEVKYTGFLPGYIKDMVQQSVTRQQSISKYTLCRTAGY